MKNVLNIMSMIHFEVDDALLALRGRESLLWTSPRENNPSRGL
jgi:hypothetical protein